MTKDEILLAQKKYLFPSVFHYFAEPLVISHVMDQYVWDADGRQYLDFFGGIVPFRSATATPASTPRCMRSSTSSNTCPLSW